MLLHLAAVTYSWAFLAHRECAPEICRAKINFFSVLTFQMSLRYLGSELYERGPCTHSYLIFLKGLCSVSVCRRLYHTVFRVLGGVFFCTIVPSIFVTICCVFFQVYTYITFTSSLEGVKFEFVQSFPVVEVLFFSDLKGKVFYGQEPPSIEFTTTECCQLSTTCSIITKVAKIGLLVAVDHNKERRMASKTVDQLDFLNPPFSWEVPPERLVCSINRCSSATAGIRSCNLATFSMRGYHFACAATQCIKRLYVTYVNVR